MEQFCGSEFWNWNLTWYTSSPQLTPCFEETVVSWTPCLFLFIFSPLDIWQSHRTKHGHALPWSPLGLGKIILLLGLTLIEVIGGFIDTSAGRIYSSTAIIQHFIQTLTYILFLCLLVYGKRHGVHSSGIQSIYWLLALLSQCIKFWSLLHNGLDENVLVTAVTSFVLGVLTFAFVAAQFLLHCFADFRPISYQRGTKNVKNISPEGSASFFSQMLFHWFTSLAWSGFRKPLVFDDLWTLNEEDTSKVIAEKFDANFPLDLNKSFRKIFSQNSTIKREKVNALRTLLNTYGRTFLCGIILKLIPDLLLFVSPQILDLLINFVGKDPSEEQLWKGILYSAALFCAAFLATLLLAQATHRFYLCGMRARTALVSAIYRKALLLSNTAKKQSTVGEIVTLMSVDVKRGTEFIQYAYLFWSAPIQISLALYFLWGILGPSSIAGLLVMILVLPLNAYMAKKIRQLQVIQMAKKDERVKLMNEILSGIKVLKFYAWEECFQEKVMQIRQVELRMIKQSAIWNALTNVVWSCSPFVVALASFATYVLIDPTHVLDASKTFVSLSLFNIMGSSLTFLPLIIVNLVQANVAFKRIDRYLDSDEIDTEIVSHDLKESSQLMVEKGFFSWGFEETTLRNINLRIFERSLVAIVGTVGSGKSSLLSALLGELEIKKGRVNTKGRIAYVAQEAWIQNATLRENILFGKAYSPVRYDRVLEACALKPDLVILPAGDRTEIGEKGINLSGGQKQRVALARAAYADADLYLLDDPLSAVDAHVGKHIFENLIGPRGLLRKKTRLLVTHGIVYLPQVDSVVVMRGGEINRHGTYKSLLAEGGEFAEFLKAHLTPEDVEDMDEGSEFLQDLKTVIDEQTIKTLRDRKTSGITGSESELLSSTEMKQPPRNYKMQNGRSSLGPNEKLIVTEHSETDSVKISIYLEYFKAAGFIFAMATFFLNLGFQVFAIGANLWLTRWSNEPASSFRETRDFFLGIYGGFGILQMLSILGATIAMAYGTVRSSSTLHSEMLQRILKAPMHFFDTTPIGRIINRFSNDMDILDTFLPIAVRFWLNGIFNVLATLFVISYSTPIFIAVVIPVIIFYYFVQQFYVASSRQLKRLESVSRSPIYSHFGETITGAPTIRAYGQQERFIKQSEAKVDENQVSYYCSIVANRWLAVRLETIGNTVVLFAALFAVLGRSTLDPGIVGLSITYALQITLALLMLVRFTTDVETNIVAVERIQEYSDAPQEAPFKFPGNTPNPKWPQTGDVTFNSYQTRYRPGLELVLHNVTCKIKGGEKIGIVGRTGAGKSSLTLALFRIIEAAGGSISIDGIDISRLGLHDLRGRIAIIPQDPVLFSGSLRINVDPFGAFSDEMIWRSLELSHLKPFIMSLPAGLQHEISEGGGNLSVGQRQLICLARAILRKTKILVLDEATAAVDLDTDNLIQETIKSEFEDSTVITIAHRLHTILDSTRVIVLDKGEIREFDTPENLLNNSESIFYKMAKDAGIAGLSS